MGNSAVRNAFEVMGMFIALAAFGMMINRSSDTAAVFKGFGDAFSGVMKTATFQGSNF